MSELNAPLLNEADFRNALTNYGGEKSKIISRDPRMFKATFDLLKAVAQQDAGKMALGVTQALASGAKPISSQFSSKEAQKNVNSASMAISTLKVTMEIANVTKLTSTGAIITYLGAATIQKTGIAVSLIGSSEEKAKCVGAIMELAGSTVITGLSAPTGVLLILSIASLSASAFNTTESCKQYLR